MALSERNVAYDISLFEERKIAIDPQKQDNIVKLPRNRVGARQNRKLNPMALLLLVFAFLLSVAVIGAIIFSQVQLTETTDQINKVTKQLEECTSESTQLQMKIKEKLSPGMVEEYAKNKLHMEKTNPCQVEYFSLSSGDKAEVTQGKGALLTTRICNGFADAKNLVVPLSIAFFLFWFYICVSRRLRQFSNAGGNATS